MVCAILFLPFWWLERLIPRNKNLFLFGACYGHKYSDNSKALFEYILKNEPKIKPYWVTFDKKVYQELLLDNKPVIMAYSLKGWLLHLRASFVFYSSTGDTNIYAVNGARRICLWHGMPLKKILFDTHKGLRLQGKDGKVTSKIKKIIRDFIFPYYLYSKKPYFSISSSEFFVPFLSSAFLIDSKNIWFTGLPRTDYYYQEKKEEFISLIRNKYNNSRIVLYMPTFRRLRNYGKFYNPFSDSNFDINSFTGFLETNNIVFLYKPHYFDKTFNYSISSERFVLIKDEDYDELYVLISNIDILVTDYSSVYFDFLCLNKPVVLTPFDYDTYIKKSREHYFDYDLLPSIKAYNWNELMTIIADEKYFSLSKEEADKFCKYNDGHASEKCFQKTLELMDRI